MSSTTAEHEQRHRALDRANQVRLARACLRRRIATGNATAVAVLLDTPPEAEGWAISGLLTAEHRWGANRVRKLLGQNRISELKPVRELTARQRQVLVRALGYDAEDET